MINVNEECFLEHYAEMPDPDFPVHMAFHHKTALGIIFEKHFHHLLFKNEVGKDEEIRLLIQRMIDEYSRQQPGFELVIKACAYNLIVLLIRNHTEKTLNDAEYRNQKRNVEFLRGILDYINTNYNEKIDIPTLAAKSNTSYSHFCRTFKKITGATPIDYINQLRINRALELMRETSLNITEIAVSVGFNDTNYFSRVFKQIKKTPPSKFMKSAI